MKTCTKCKIEKPLDEFYNAKGSRDGKRSRCKDCEREYRLNNKEKRKNYYENNKEKRKNYYENNKEKIKEKKKIYFAKNKEKIKEYRKLYNEKNKEKTKNYYEKNKEKIKEYHQKNKEKIKEYQEKYRQENKEKRKKKDKEYHQKHKERKNKYYSERRKKEPLFKMKSLLSSRTSLAFKLSKWSKNSGNIDMLGCTYEKAFNHIEKQFTEGMSWDNHSLHGWHIDHVIPLASAKTEEELKSLCHYTNLQPLWAKDNLSKGAKVIY